MSRLESQVLDQLERGPVRGWDLKKALGYHSGPLFYSHMAGLEDKGIVVGYDVPTVVDGVRLLLRWYRLPDAAVAAAARTGGQS